MEWKNICRRLQDGEIVYSEEFDVEISDKKTNIYLAGPVNSFPGSDRVREEATSLSEMIPAINLVDPLASEPNDRESIPKHDIQMLSECDGVIAYYIAETESWGTCGELYTAAQLDLPIVFWVIGKPKSNRYSSWMESLSQKREKDFRSAVYSVLEAI